jgi:hypothetical protein
VAVTGVVDLVTALQGGRFADVEGTPEADWVDFKRTAYPTETQRPLRLTERGRWELCKDVAAFANGSGGCLLLGFPEVADPNLGVKVAGKLTPIEVSSVDLDHYRDVLERGVYPVPKGIELRWFVQDGSQPPAGALLVHVPEAADRPLVLTRVVAEQGEAIQAVGVPVRNADRVNWYPTERIHHLLRQAERMSVVADVAVSDQDVWPRADDDIDYLVRQQDWAEKAVLFVQAVPGGGPSRLPDFYDVVREKLERPDSIRPVGFNLRSLGGSADVIAGALIVRRMDDAAARVDPDGLLTVGALASPEFLGWSVNRSADDTMMRVNSTTLVELILECCRFVHDVLRPRSSSARWTYRLVCRLFQTHQVALAAGPASGSIARWDWRIASTDLWDRRVDAGTSPTQDAFEVAAESYALFGLPESAIPYSVGREISLDRIRELDRARQ